MKKTKLKSMKYTFPIIVFFILTVLIFGPLSLFLSNSEEFWFTLYDVLKVVLFISILSLFLLFLFFSLLTKKAHIFFRKLLLGITLGFFVQARINISYGSGVLDGTEIQWDQYIVYGIIDTFVWIICLVLPFGVAHICKKKKVSGIVLGILAVFLIVVQIPGFILQLGNYQPHSNSELFISSTGIFDLGKKDNIIIFILDTMDESYYQDFIQEQPEYTDNLDGFVHYNNTLASGARTPIAVPSMFTGIPFIRSNSYSDYKAKVWSDKNSLNILHNMGYDVRFFSEAVLFSESNIQYIENFTDGGTSIGSYPLFSKILYKLVMFKLSPHFVKHFFWLDTADFDETIDMTVQNPYKLDDAKFFSDFQEKGFTFNSYDNTVRIYHLRGAHSPYKLSKNGTSSKTATRRDQVAGCFYSINLMLSKLKESGMYDSSTIIITADHGEIHVSEHPLFLLKISGATEPYTTSHAPVSLFDLPIFLAKHVNRTLQNQEYGIDMFSLKEDDERERHIFVNKTGNNKIIIQEYVTFGNAGDYDSLIPTKTHEDPLGKDTPYILGTPLSFESDATGNRYVVSGFGINDGFRTRLRSKINELEIPIKSLPDEGFLSVTIFPSYYFILENQICKISANGINVFESTTDIMKRDKSVIYFEVPVTSFADDNILKIVIDFPDVDENELTSNGVLSFVSMTIDKIKTN